jgi:catechol-2,3-dioxygenase
MTTPDFLAIDHIHVYVTDRQAAEKWYKDALGLTREPGLEFWAAGLGPLTIANTSGSVHIALFERPHQACRSVVALSATTEQFLQWQAHLSKVLGSPLQAVDHEASWSIYFTDPDGNPYEITCYDYAELSKSLKQ